MTLLQTRLERRAAERRERIEDFLFAMLGIIGAGLFIIAALPWVI